MATTDRWAQPQIVREQITLFQPTLDDMIPQDHEVRLLDETLRTLDWSAWEASYKRGGAGQPPIHPRVLAGIWLYAMMRRIRTSRPLEYACRHNVDFMWLAEGRTPDHTTLATFFSKNKEPLKDLFKQVCPMAMTLGWVRSASMPRARRVYRGPVSDVGADHHFNADGNHQPLAASKRRTVGTRR